MLLSPPNSPPDRDPSPLSSDAHPRAYTRRRSEPDVDVVVGLVPDAPGPAQTVRSRKPSTGAGSHRASSASRYSRVAADRNGSRPPNPNILTRSASASSRRAQTRVTSPPPPPHSPTPSHASPSTTPRQSDFGFPPVHHHRQQPLSPIPRRASASARMAAGFMTPGTSPNHPFASLPEEGQDAIDGRTSAPPMSVSYSAGPSTRSYTGARSLGVGGSHPSSPLQRPNPSKRSHIAAAAPATRCISRTLPQEERSLHVPPSSPSRQLTAEVCLRGLLDKSGGPCSTSTSNNGGRMMIDLDSLDLEEEMRRAQETLEEDMVRWANGEGDVPRLLALQEAINAARPGSSMSANSGHRQPSQSSGVHARHADGSASSRRGSDEASDEFHMGPPRNGFAQIDRRPTLDTHTKKRTHSTSSSPSVRSMSSGLAPLSSSPRSFSHHKLPSPLYASLDLPSAPTSGPSSASTSSYTGPLPSSDPPSRSPHSRPASRSLTMPIPAVPQPPSASANSPPPQSSLTSIMSSSSIHSPSSARRSSSRASRPSFSATGHPASPSLRAVSQAAVPTRARLGSECKDFDLETSYQKCNELQGYVSFADVGVGCPLGLEDEDEEDEAAQEGKKAGGSWWGWLAGGGEGGSSGGKV